MSKEEVLYTKAKIGRRMLAHFIDLGILAFSAIILFTLSNVLLTKAPFYTSRQETLTNLRNESGLYIDGYSILTYVSNDEEFPTYFDKKEVLKNGLEAFYVSATYFESPFEELQDYRARQLEAVENGVHLFVLSDDKVVENTAYNNDEGWYNFYKYEIENYATGYLTNNHEFVSLTQFSFLFALGEIVGSLTLCFTIFYLILPLTCFKRGRQTIGMKLEKFALINVHAVNVNAGVYVGRFFFMLIIFVYLNFFAFLIPSILSISMMFLSKSSSSLVNYVFNDYMVDVTNQKIYYNALELEEAKFTLQKASIENKEFKLK